MSYYQPQHMYQQPMMYPQATAGRTGGFALIVVLFILLVIVGSAYLK